MRAIMQQTGANKTFGGWTVQYKHASKECGCDMAFTVYYPPQAQRAAVPVVYYLSGLTCTDANFPQKAGAQRVAADLGLAFVCPDTSPRGLSIPGEDDSWDFGSGAGFYVDATEPAWAKNYRMYSYITDELPSLLRDNASGEHGQIDVDRASVMGHSMGGHGALVAGLRNPDKYASISAFSAICNPCECPWGKKAFSNYLGGEEGCKAWQEYDATHLMTARAPVQTPMLLDQGTGDNFYESQQLLPEALKEAAEESGAADVTVRMQEDYDHSYFFISTFVEDHLRFHAQHLL